MDEARCGAVCPGKFVPVLMFQGQSCSHFRSFTIKIVAQAVCDLFGGDLDRFLQEGELVFNGVRPVLRQQVGRLSPLEHLLLTWLAVLREWTPLDTLSQVLHPRVLRSKLLEALEALAAGAGAAGEL